jgi:hypothetical protein
MKIEKKKKFKKRDENRPPWLKWGGPERATPTAGLGWSNHPQAQGGGRATPKRQKKKKKKKNGFWTFGGGFSHPVRPVWGGRSHPRPLGVVRPPPKVQKPFFLFFFFWPFGVAGPPPWPWGWFDHPRPAVGVAPATLDFHPFF